MREGRMKRLLLAALAAPLLLSLGGLAKPEKVKVIVEPPLY